MSRIGKHPIAVPAGVEVKVDGSTVTVKGPKGTLTKEFKPSMSIVVDGGFVTVTRPDDEKENRALHGLTRTLIHNMIEGVTNGFKKELDVNGVSPSAGLSMASRLMFSEPKPLGATVMVHLFPGTSRRVMAAGVLSPVFTRRRGSATMDLRR